MTGRPFPKGKSGNPKGRPTGARGKTAMAVEKLLEGEASALTRKAIDLALAGDTVALRLCMERILPPRKGRLLTFALPSIKCAGAASKAHGALLAAVASGAITPDEASDVGKLIEGYAKTLEARDLEERIDAIEQRMSNETVKKTS